MLSLVRSWTCITILAVVCGLSVSVPAAAQGSGVVCAEFGSGNECVLWLNLELSGDPASVSVSVHSGGGTQAECDRGPNYTPGQFELQTVPCHRPGHGWYSQTYDCHFIETPMSPQNSRVILPDGYQPGDEGAVYQGFCYTGNEPEYYQDYCWSCATGFEGPGHYRFLESPPDGYDGEPDPVPGLLVEAIEELALEGPTIGTAPPAGSDTGLVRLPVWLWNEVSPNNWGTPSQTAGPIAGISVVAQAEATGIVWDMGDGTTVECDEGVAYELGMPVYEPPCGHRYAQTSRDQPGGEYEISATTTWVLEWTTQGLPEERGGEFELEATSTTSLQISELQVLYGS